MTTYSQTSWTIENRKGGKAVWVFFYAVKSLLRWIAQTRFLVLCFVTKYYLRVFLQFII